MYAKSSKHRPRPAPGGTGPSVLENSRMTVCEQFEDVRCDMCGSAGRIILYQYQLHANQANIVVCDRCGFTYLCPRPKSSRLHEFYGETYYSFRIERTPQSSLKDALRRTVM